MPRFSANLSLMFTEVPLLDRFAAASAAGFDAVEVQFPYEAPATEIASRIADAGVKFDLLNLPPGDFDAGDRGLAVLPDRREEFETAVERALNYSSELGAKKIHLMAGIADPNDGRAREALLSAISHAASQAGPDRTILLEPLNTYDVPGFFLNNYEVASDIITELGLGNVKLLFDVYHRQLLAGDISHAFERFMQIIGHIQIAAVPDRGEPDQGELAYGEIFDMIDASPYRGYVGAEYSPRNLAKGGRTEDGLGWFQPYRIR